MIGRAEVEAARERIRDAVLVTPTVVSPRISEETGAQVWLKLESFQRTGSFKARGALHKILRLPAAEREHGVIAASAGNHAQGVAFAASRVGIPATIVMPLPTPLVKVSATKRWGAEVVLHGETFDAAYEHARRLQEERGLVFVHPFDDDEVIAGQGTAGLEIAEQVPDAEVVVVPIGGGGLISGIATALYDRGVEVWGVQSETSPAMARSFAAGERVDQATSRTIAEGISVKRPGQVTWPYVRERVKGVVLVSETEIEAAVFRLLDIGKLVTEGAGAAAVAAVLTGRIPGLAGRKAVAIVSGGNIDLNILSRLIERSLVRSHRLTRVRLTLPDRPGALAGTLAIVAEHGANVLRIHHNRFFTASSFWETEVELTLETRGEEQVAELLGALEAAGYARIERPDIELTAAPLGLG